MGESFFSDSDLKDLAETKVAERGEYLYPRTRAGKVLVLGAQKKDTDMMGKAYFLDLLLLSAVTAPNAVNGDDRTNMVGTRVSKSFFVEDGSKKKQAAVKGDLIRTAVAIYNTMTGNNLAVKAVQADGKLLASTLAAFQDGTGVVLDVSARDAETEEGEHRTYHNLAGTRMTKEQIKKNRELIAKDSPATAYV